MNEDPPTPTRSAPERGAGNVIPLSSYRARLSRGKRARRADALLETPDPERAIRALPGDELYYLLREDDLREARDLLAYATPEQIQVVLDFGLWSGDRVLPQRLEEWVEALAELPVDTISSFVQGLDSELVGLLIRKGARIYDLTDGEPPDDPRGAFYPTPDGFFVLDIFGYHADEPAGATDGPENGGAGEESVGPSAQALTRIVDALYRADLTFARRILVGAKGELDSELEEMALRWRRGRMADLGFVDAIEALDVYRELDPDSVRIGELPPGTRMRPQDVGEGETRPPDFLRAPAVLADHLGGSSLLGRALARVPTASEVDELHFAIVSLANRVLSADRVDPADERAVAASLDRMRATLDVAVEVLARGGGKAGGALDEDRAVDAVRTIPMIRLFRLGVTVIGKVRKLALALRKGGPFAGLTHLDLVEEPEASVLEAATRARPLYAEILDQPPAAGERPFRSLADLARAAAAIERAAVAQALLLRLGVRPEHLTREALQGVTPSDLAAIDAGVLARTALALSTATAVAKAPPKRARAATAESATFRPLLPTEAARLDPLGTRGPATAAGGRSKARSGAESKKTVDLPRARAEAAPPSPLREHARRVLEQAWPPGAAPAGREIAARWLETLAPLGTVLVRPPTPASRR